MKSLIFIELELEIAVIWRRINEEQEEEETAINNLFFSFFILAIDHHFDRFRLQSTASSSVVQRIRARGHDPLVTFQCGTTVTALLLGDDLFLVKCAAVIFLRDLQSDDIWTLVISLGLHKLSSDDLSTEYFRADSQDY